MKVDDPTPPHETGTLPVPGQALSLRWRRDAAGRLVELGCGARTHLLERDGARYFGDDLVIVTELQQGSSLLRVVRAHDRSWVETYAADPDGRVCHVDGIDVRRDAAGRVIAAGAWSYGYEGDALVTVEGPFGARRIERDPRGRALSVRGGAGFAYDGAGRRTDAATLPATHHRDARGRLWTVTDGDGRVLATYLWEGSWCLGRIDGDATAPLAAVFSLDPTGTPVRVIDRAGVRRLPRDAFGEALLAETGVPGLYGGAIHDGLCYLPARPLDPRVGSFCAPDPFSGGPVDPRRAEGYRGPLYVERPGDYVICRNDPIGRADPTGCISAGAVLVGLSSVTWASTTTLFGVLGLDLGVNFWGSLVTGKIGDWFTSFGDTLAARRHGGFGVRRGGLLGFSRAYTVGHYLMNSTETFNGFGLISAFVPSAAMSLRGYGTLLQLTPSDSDEKTPFLLDGSRGINGVPAARGWTRGGGASKPVYNGATVPSYDAGALHINRVWLTPAAGTSRVASSTVHGPQTCTLLELEPTGRWAAGLSLARLVVVRLSGTSLGIGIGNLELLTDVSGQAVIAPVLNVVEVSGGTDVTLETDGVPLNLAADIRLRSIGAATSTELVSVPTSTSAPAGALDTNLTTAPYAAGDPLRLSQNAGPGLAPVGAAVILRLEAQVGIDATLPSDFTALSLTVVVPGPGGDTATVTSSAVTSVLTCPGLVPAINSLVAVTVGGSTQVAAAQSIAANPAGGQDVTLDRPITLNGGGTWAPLVPSGGSFGTAQTADATPTITYLPASPRTIPPVGTFLSIAASNKNPTARTLATVNYDALVLGALPGTPALGYSIERFPFLSIDQPGLRLRTETNVLSIDPALTPPANQQLSGVALRLHELAGPTLAAAAAPGVGTNVGLPPLTVTGQTLTGSLNSGATFTNPNPGQLMLLSDGAALLELTVVTKISVTVSCDRAWNGPLTALEAFPLTASGPAYPATVPPGAAGTLVLSNQLPTAAGTVIAEMPRIAANEIVSVRWTEPGVGTFTDLFSVSAVEVFPPPPSPVVLVDSTTITLANGSRPPPPDTSTGITVTRQVPTTPNPQTGSAREAIDGAVGAPLTGTTTPSMTFSIWGVGALRNAVGYAIADKTAFALPMRFATPTVAVPSPLTITLGAAPIAFGPGTVVPNLVVPGLAPSPPPPPVPPATVTVPVPGSTVYAASFSREANILTLNVHPDELVVLATVSGNIIVAVEFGPGTNTTPVAGRLTSATTLIPEDTSFELDTKESLVEHELRHTEQYAWLGPLMWGFFPLLPMVEKVYPQFDASEYSPYFDGQLIPGVSPEQSQKDENKNPKNRRVGALRLSNLGATKVNDGDRISAGQNVLVKLGAQNPNDDDPADAPSFLLDAEDFANLSRVATDANVAVDVGKLKVRKMQQPKGAWREVLSIKTLLSTLPTFLTPGALTELAVANTWGWVVYLVTKLSYVIYHWRTDEGGFTTFADVSGDGTTLLIDPVGVDAMADASRIIVKLDKSQVTRAAGPGPTDAELVLPEPLPAEMWGKGVEVAPYATHSPGSLWDWHRYYPAKLVDPTKPASVVVLPADQAGKNTLTLAVRDNVLMRAGKVSKRSRVTTVNADGSYDLEDPPLSAIGQDNALDQEFQIAKVGEHDPVGSLGAVTANFIGAPWLGKVVDPWAWVLSKPTTTPGSFGDWALRVLRWIGSSRAWSMMIPGVVWLDALFKGAGQFRAWMEQDASENSGELYTSIGRLENGPTLVGDIGRYWFFPRGSHQTDYPGNGFDQAGAQVLRELVVAPLVTAEIAGGPPTINKGAGSPAPSTTPPTPGAPLPFGAGDCVPDALYTKVPADPRTPSAPAAAVIPAFTPTDRGMIPLSPGLERTNGVYVAYSRPGRHRATIVENYNSGALFTNEVRDARSVVDSGAGFFGFKSVTLLFDQTIGDINVTIGGVTVANDATVPLVLTQTAIVAVPPDPNRRYALTLRQPATGTLLQADKIGSDPNTIQVQAPNPLPAVVTEEVELCRVYRFDPATGKFDDAVLNTFGMNLPGDLRIPVRRFNVLVTATITARNKISTDPADDVTATTPGVDVFVLVPTGVAVQLAIVISYTPAPAITPQNPQVTANSIQIPTDLANLGVTGTAFQIHCEPTDPPEQPATLALSVGVAAAGLTATLTGTLTLNPFFVLNAASFVVARGGTLTLTAQDLANAPVSIASVAAIPGVTIPTPVNNVIILNVDAAAPTGNVRVVATSTGGVVGARTIQIT